MSKLSRETLNEIEDDVQRLIAAAVMDYDNHYHRGRPDIKTWFTD